MGLFKKQKDPVVEMEKDLVHEENGMEHDIQADVDAVMKKYDRESNTRVWEGIPKTMLRALMASFSVYCILMTLFSKALPERRLSLFLGFIIIIGYLVYPARKGAARVNHVPWYDWILMVLGAGSFFYFAINAFSIIQLATKLQPVHIIVGAIGIVVLIELCRRCVGLPILVVLGLLLIYTFYNQLSWDPSFYKALKNIVYKLFYTTSGVIGTPVSVCYTYIVLFIIFGAFLERTGIANFFISFANRLAGWSSGGPAKVAVISSALCGMVFVSGVPQSGLPEAGEATGILLALLSAVLYASDVSINKLLDQVPACERTLVQLAVAALVMIPYILLTEDVAAMALTPLGAVLLLIVGVFHTGWCYSLFFGSMTYLPAQTVVLFSYIDPIVAIFLSALLLKEPLGWSGILGAVLVLGSTLISELPVRAAAETK